LLVRAQTTGLSVPRGSRIVPARKNQANFASAMQINLWLFDLYMKGEMIYKRYSVRLLAELFTETYANI